MLGAGRAGRALQPPTSTLTPGVRQGGVNMLEGQLLPQTSSLQALPNTEKPEKKPQRASLEHRPEGVQRTVLCLLPYNLMTQIDYVDALSHHRREIDRYQFGGLQ